MSADDTQEGPEADAGKSAADIERLDLTDENLDEAALTTSVTTSGKRETTRQIIAYALLALLTLTSVAWVVIGVVASDSTAGPSLDKIFTGILGLTGTVVGFYFGSASQEQKR
jgi:hypothetical protein